MILGLSPEASWVPFQNLIKRLARVKTRRYEINGLDYRVAFNFVRHVGSTTVDVLVKFQSDWKVLNTNLAASNLREIVQ